ncbi:PREDICTED: uncharacterized protein LOC109476507 [Branchiostoma belcheri]|uniref:Uncharacterized protein LOC109476507 n=1 Tax=Branchiostoma belcheri TaxID=7741 RepID=A0A6P4ZTX3_BRABE|nr:PREDICTED: uncharacterized protein LOC109476507 [Branchiostoma belcheri]XP_019633046.1 PREDICTED: uncharacterized protein LOC109476507 [Branchiostoma belcheri]XP_019633055.1 PREDICTED: uncharacterized protein LOC109476507 [Branchiostoma belcheri]
MSDRGIPFKYFYYIKQQVCDEWEDLAGFLGFDPPAIKNIKGRNPDDASRCRDLLGEWQRRKGDEATMGVVMEALSDMGLDGVLDGLKQKYPELKKEPMPQSGPIKKAMREAAGTFLDCLSVENCKNDIMSI